MLAEAAPPEEGVADLQPTGGRLGVVAREPGALLRADECRPFGPENTGDGGAEATRKRTRYRTAELDRRRKAAPLTSLFCAS